MEKTNLEILTNNLDKHKIINKHLLCGKDKDKIVKYLKEKKNYFLYEEKELLGTAGCLTRLKYEKLSKNLLVIYGDLLFNIDIKRFYKFHLKKKKVILPYYLTPVIIYLIVILFKQIKQML